MHLAWNMISIDGDDDGGDDVDEDKKYSNVDTKINTLIDVGILRGT